MAIQALGNVVSLTNDRVNHQLMQMIIKQQLENPKLSAPNALIRPPPTAMSGGDQSLMQFFAA